MLPRSAGLALAMLLAGCSGIGNVVSDMKYRYRDVSLGDRCGYFVQQAFPEMRLADAKVQSATDMNVTTIGIAAVNDNAGPTGQLAHDVGVECRFRNGVLTSFRWTAGPFR
jgi:hypothetical protein